MSDLEKQFRKTYEEVREKVDLQIEIAKIAIAEAVKLSEEFGVPIVSDTITFRPRVYMPKSFEDKWGENLLDECEYYPPYALEDFIYDLTNIYANFEPELGWEYWSPSNLACFEYNQ